MYISNNLTGISQQRAQEHLERYGPNALPDNNKNHPILLFIKQFLSPFIYILLGVAFISFLTGERTDAFVILIILVINAVVGTLQEYKANNAIKALKKLSHTKSRVLREKILHTVKTDEVTIDDIVYLESGDLIPADGEILESHMVAVNESQITGESLPVNKALKDKLYRGSVVISGNAFMLVKKIGKDTFVGSIAKDIANNADKKTELEKKLSSFSLYLLIALGIALVAFMLFSLKSGIQLITALKTTVALGVATIPEGLPIVLTVVLSLGALHISRAKAMLRNLPSGSTLASVSFICTDKTGTITHGNLTVKEVVNINTTNLSETQFNSYMYHSIDIKDINGEKVGDVLDLTIEKHLNDSFTFQETKELPFTSETKYNAKEYIVDGTHLQIFKGAPEALGISSDIITPYVKEGFRVLGVGYKKLSSSEEFTTSEITPLGLIVFEDKIREEVAQSITECKQAGIKILMITGDNILTAEHVARKVGILAHDGETSLTGDMLDAMSDKDLKEKLITIKVLARANPIHKERIVKLLQEKGEVVAMTGDGVNDGPALSLANIGISMGKSGTEVAREASDLVLLNDDFSDIVLAIFEARTISENIRKTIVFLMTSSVGIVVAILGSLLLGIALPFLAIQILWLNFVTTGLLDVSIATEEPESIYRRYNFKRYHGFLINFYDLIRILILGTFIGAATIFGFYLFTIVYMLEVGVARTACMLLISAFIWFNAFNTRKNYDHVFMFSLFTNKFVIGAVIIETIILLGSIFSPLGNRFLHTQPITIPLIILMIIFALTILIVDVIIKETHKHITNQDMRKLKRLKHVVR